MSRPVSDRDGEFLPPRGPQTEPASVNDCTPAIASRVLRYRARMPVSAILHKPGGKQISVMLPGGALLICLPNRRFVTLLGMVDVHWAGREYSIFAKDLHKKCERFRSKATSPGDAQKM